MSHRGAAAGSAGLALVLAAVAAVRAADHALAERNERLFEQLQQTHGLGSEQMSAVRRIFAHSGYIGQGNPAIARHPISEAQCR